MRIVKGTLVNHLDATKIRERHDAFVARRRHAADNEPPDDRIWCRECWHAIPRSRPGSETPRAHSALTGGHPGQARCRGSLT